jgi:N-methylhydantoinase A
MTPLPARESDIGPNRQGTRGVYFNEAAGFVDTAVFSRDDLRSGDRIEGPALVQEYASSTVVFPDDILTVDPFGHLSISVGGLRP